MAGRVKGWNISMGGVRKIVAERGESLSLPSDISTTEAVPLPREWEGEVRPRLGVGERILSWFAPDLNPALRYCEGLVVLTDRRVFWGERRE